MPKPKKLTLLQELESRIAVACFGAETDEEEKALYKAKAKVMAIVREMRLEAKAEREEA